MKKWLKGDEVEFKKLINREDKSFTASVSLVLNPETNRVDYKFGVVKYNQ